MIFVFLKYFINNTFRNKCTSGCLYTIFVSNLLENQYIFYQKEEISTYMSIDLITFKISWNSHFDEIQSS